MIVEQYEVGNFGVFCYLIGDEESQEGLFIDPRTMLRGLSQKLNLMDWIKLNISSTPISCGPYHGKRGDGQEDRSEDRRPRRRCNGFGSDSFRSPGNVQRHNLSSCRYRGQEGDVIQVGNVGLKVIHTPRSFRRWNVPLSRWKGVYRGYPLCRLGGENRFARELMGCHGRHLFGTSSMSYPERRWSSRVITMDPRRPRPFNMSGDTIPLSVERPDACRTQTHMWSSGLFREGLLYKEFEIRNTKFETISNDQILNIRNK